MYGSEKVKRVVYLRVGDSSVALAGCVKLGLGAENVAGCGMDCNTTTQKLSNTFPARTVYIHGFKT